MSLNVGELVATLTVDDARFTRGIQDSQRSMSAFEQVVRQATTRVDTGFRDSAQSVGRLGTASQEASRDVSRVGTSANDISRVSTESRQAATSVDRIGAAARTTAQDVGRIGDAASDATRELAGVGDESGRDAGGNFLSSFSDALSSLPSKAGPVAGSILGIATLGVGAGVALAAAIKEGMEAELSRDLFQAQTATTTAQAEKFARAAGEAYADVLGSSVEENLSTLKLALQSNLIDPGATQRDAEAVIASLDTISVALDTDVATSVTAVSALMSNDLATSAQEASDMIANAVGGSANKGGDLLEVVAEYSSGWKNAGLSAEYALALIEQSTDNGADTADRAGDSLREFGRRVTEEGDSIVEAIDNIGLSGQDMYDAFKRGGPDAEDAFDAVFDKIRQIEDPVERNTAAMALLGDTAGDFIGSLAQWDPSEALKNFGEFEGAAGRLASTIGGNPATSVEGAMRSITTVIDGLKGALAEAFGPEIAEWAAAISNNRAGVIDFFIGVGNGAFEASKALAGFVSDGLAGLAEFAGAGTDMSVSFLRSLADMADGLDTVSTLLSFVIPGMGSIDTGGMADKLNSLADSAEKVGTGIEDGLRTTSDFLGGEFIDRIDQGQERFNEFAGNMRLSAAFNDESAKVAASISEIGVAADGSMHNLESFNGKALEMLPPGMNDNVRALSDGFREQVRTGLEAGNTVEALTGQYESNRGALIDQLMATGMSNKAAVEYINTLGLTPELVETLIEQPGMPEAHYALDVLNEKVVGIPDEKTVTVQSLTDDAKADLEALGFTVQENTKDGTVTIIAATDEAAEQLRLFRERNRELHMNLTLSAVDGPRGITAGQQVSSVDWSAVPRSERADGAFEPKNTQAHIQNTQITTYGEPETEGESYIPHAMSKRARSEAILSETAKRFGLGLVRSFADGGVITKTGHDESLEWARSMDPVGYGMGGFSTNSIDCSGAVAGAINKALGLDAYDSRMSTVTEGSWLQAKGAILGKGPEGTIRVGWWDEGGGANGHTAMTYADGTNFESNGSEGVVVGGETGWDDPSFTDHAWFPNSGDLGLASDTGTGSAPPEGGAGGTGESGGSTDMAYATTESGALMSTDGQRVYVTNWPSSMGDSQAKPDDERKPILTAGLKVFANGGIEDHTAQIAGAGDMRVWAEPETGGEAYVPLAPGKRGRSVEITRQVANRFGYQLVPMADGGLTGFGGWQNDDRPTLDMPLDGKGVSPNKARANAYALAALAAGGANTFLSGFDGKGNFTGKFDTGSNSPALLEAGLSQLTELLEAQTEELRKITAAAENPTPVDVQVDIDQGNRSAEIAIMKAGL